MLHRLKLPLLLLVIVALKVVTSPPTVMPVAPPPRNPAAFQVKAVLAGNAIAVEDARGNVRQVQLACVALPMPERLREQAKARLTEILQQVDNQVYLSGEAGQAVEVYLLTGEFVQQLMVAEGVVFADRLLPSCPTVATIVLVEQRAKQQRLGLWRAAEPNKTVLSQELLKHKQLTCSRIA